MVKSRGYWISLVINQGLNLIFTAIFFYPIVLLWFKYYNFKTLILILGISITSFFMPLKLYRYIQLSKSRAFYESLAIDQFQHFTQQGKFAKWLIGFFSDEETNRFDKKRIAHFKNQIRAFESYHFACLIFFLGSFIYAFKIDEYIFLLVIFVSNVFYNVVPILIQQYNKIRISGFLK